MTSAAAPLPVRVIDTGIRGARANVAFDQALIEARNAGRIPDTVRFLRFRPSALVGLHQILSHEVRLDYCRANGIEVGRRITGGGGLYLDQGQLGWELVLDRSAFGTTDLAAIAARICEAAAAGLRRLGVAAQFRSRNDIEVEGRKIGGTGGFFDGDTLFYQGTLLIAFDPQDMVKALNVPAEKLAKRALDSPASRVVTLAELMGADLPDRPAIKNHLLGGFAEALGIETEWGAPTPHEEDLARELYAREIGTDEFVAIIDPPSSGPDLVTASRSFPGGTIKVFVRLEGPRSDRVREVLITGDFFVTPPRIVYDLEASLRGLAARDAPLAAEAFLSGAKLGLLTIAPADFRAVIEAALATPRA